MTDFLHIISVYKSDLLWINQLKGPYILYYKDSPQHKSYNNVNICGAETNILKFIIDFYEKLPEICVFTHPYNNKWTHKGNLYDIVNNIYINKTNLLNFGKISHLSYNINDNDNIRYDFMKNTNWWKETMQEYFGDMPYNFGLGKMPGGQFYVNSNTIKRLPKKFYIDMLSFLLEKSIKNTLYDSNNQFNEFWMSRYMEWSWEFIFTAPKL